MSTEETLRTVTVVRTGSGRFQATNVRGGTLEFGTGKDTDFTPVELLLAALGGCAGVDVDILTTRRAEPESFEVVVNSDKIRDDLGNRLTNIETTFTVRFPQGAEGDAARALMPDAVRKTQERLCTVSRTVEVGTPVAVHIAD